MLMLDKTTERLRSKHVRTLELLQKTLDENVELRDRVCQLQKGTLHLSQGGPRSNRANELEDEIDRLKAEHYAKLVATEEAARVRHDDQEKTIEILHRQQQKLHNDVFSLEARLAKVREALQSERTQWHQERLCLQQENQRLQQDIDRLSHGRDDNQERHLVEVSSMKRELETQRQLHIESDLRNARLQDELSQLFDELKVQREQLVVYTEQLDVAQSEIATLKQSEEELTADVEFFRGQNRDLHGKMANLQASSAKTESEQQYSTALKQLHQMEEQNSRLVVENRLLQESLAKLQASEVVRANVTTTGSVFATHIDLKRENFQLRAQVDELKQLQRRFLTTANKKTMKFPAI